MPDVPPLRKHGHLHTELVNLSMLAECNSSLAHLAGGVVGAHVDDAPVVREASQARPQHHRADQRRATACVTPQVPPQVAGAAPAALGRCSGAPTGAAQPPLAVAGVH